MKLTSDTGLSDPHQMVLNGSYLKQFQQDHFPPSRTVTFPIVFEYLPLSSGKYSIIAGVFVTVKFTYSFIRVGS